MEYDDLLHMTSPFFPLEDQPLVMRNVHTFFPVQFIIKKTFKIYYKPSLWKSIPMWIGLLDSYHNYLHGKKMHILHAADFTASKTSTKWRNALQYKHSLHITAAFFNYENILRCHLLVMPGGQFSLRRLQLYIRWDKGS